MPTDPYADIASPVSQAQADPYGDIASPVSAPKPEDWQARVKPIDLGNGKASVQRDDGGVWFGPEQGNMGKPGWFDAKGMRLGDAPGKPTAFMDTFSNDLHAKVVADKNKGLMGQLIPEQLGAMGGGIAKGTMSAARFAARLAGSDALDKPVEQYNQFQTQNFGDHPVMETVGQVIASPLSATKKVSALVGILKAGGIGGTYNALLAPHASGQTQGEFLRQGAKDFGVGSAFGSGGAAIGEGIGLAAGKLRAPLTPEAQAIQDLGDKFGVRTLAPDLTKAPGINKTAVLLESVPGSGMVAQRQAQQFEARAAAQKLLDQHGITGDASTQIQQGMANKLAEGKANARAAYDLVGKLSEGKGNVPLDQTLEAIKKFKAQEASAALPDQGLIGLLDKMEQRLTDPKAGVDMTFNGVRGLRSDLGSMISDYYKGTNAATGSKGVQVLQGVKGALEGDLNAFTAKNGPEIQAAARRADSIYKAEVVPAKSRVITTAIKNDEPDQIFKAIVAQGPDRAEKFYNAMDDGARAAVRSQMVKQAMDAATAQDGVFSPAKFAGALEKVKDATGVFFKGQDKFELDGLTNLMRHIQRAGQIGENPTNGQKLVQTLIAGEGIGSIASAAMGHPGALVAPAGSMVASKALTKLFSSARGKALLLSAASASPGSPAMTKLVEQDIPKFLAIQAPSNVQPLRPTLPAAADTGTANERASQ